MPGDGAAALWLLRVFLTAGVACTALSRGVFTPSDSSDYFAQSDLIRVRASVKSPSPLEGPSSLSPGRPPCRRSAVLGSWGSPGGQTVQLVSRCLVLLTIPRVRGRSKKLRTWASSARSY